MLIAFVHRLRRQVRRFGRPRRVESCPPALVPCAATPAARNWRFGLREWLRAGLNTHAPDEARYGRVRDEFLQALADIRTQQAGMLQGRIHIARSLLELWHLRPEVFKLVALHFSQAEAQTRLDRLNRHFPTRSPRSGFGALDPLAGDARIGARG